MEGKIWPLALAQLCQDGRVSAARGQAAKTQPVWCQCARDNCYILSIEMAMYRCI